MSGLILIPKMYEDRPTYDHKVVLSRVAKHYGWDFQYADELPYIPDYLFLFAVPQHNRRDFLIQEIEDLPEKTHLITWIQDVQNYGKEWVPEQQQKVFKRCDLIFSARSIEFSKPLQAYDTKRVRLFQSFAPTENYTSLPFNENPIRKCLVFGAQNPDVYPLRHWLAANGPLSDLAIAPPWAAVRGDYARMLHAHAMCFADASVFKYCLRKTFEIAATGSLLFVERCHDVLTAGFKDGENCVMFEPTTSYLVQQIKNVLNSYDSYTDIRKAGREFVFKHHSVANRVRTIIDAIDARVS